MIVDYCSPFVKLGVVHLFTLDCVYRVVVLLFDVAGSFFVIFFIPVTPVVTRQKFRDSV